MITLGPFVCGEDDFLIRDMAMVEAKGCYRISRFLSSSSLFELVFLGLLSNRGG